MCDFTEPYFGATYPDACCIEGFLWDLDSCDVPGGPLYSGGEVPCPQCNREAWLESFKDTVEMMGYDAAEKKEPREHKYEKIRFEQPGDELKIRKWWLAGYDAFALDQAALARGEGEK